MAADTVPLRRSAVPWLYGLAALLTVLVPVVLLGVWVGGAGIGAALFAAVADLVAAVIAAATATVLLARRGVRRVRATVLGHPDGRAGRLAAHGAARWVLARDRFAALQAEYARAESDPHEIAARPALRDVSVPATARFVEALGEAHDLATPGEPADPRDRERFTAAVDRAVAAWDEACRTADALAAATGPVVTGPPVTPRPTLAPGTAGRPRSAGSDEYGAAAQAVRAAAARGVRDLRERLRA
ncbi:hypothetical protein [Actinomycetospora sp. TBRC 11914]|uniref:hypothetical protein n=1 Tax=Actinomycetospora sp. TBRC 11914 TaxID=2729387 RepID=UPI00145D7764|nr:hypothetical protein [Actinomycetospora sp. TBRC 11914]NMO91139.1 hypothetical protein [Actinomycetospora sp. TBRC 11914]